MNSEKLFHSVVVVAIVCATALISQCSYREGECKKEGIKAGLKGEEISRICSSAAR